MIADHVGARARDQGDELLDHLVRREHDVGGAIPPGLLELESQTTVGQLAQAVAGDRRRARYFTRCSRPGLFVVGGDARGGLEVVPSLPARYCLRFGGTCAMASSATAVIVRLGLAPRLTGMAAPSTTHRPG